MGWVKKKKKNSYFWSIFCPLPSLLSALCVAAVTAGPGVVSPPRAFVPSAHSAAPKAQRLPQHNTITAEKKYTMKIPAGGRRLCISGRRQLSPPRHSGVTVNGNFMGGGFSRPPLSSLLLPRLRHICVVKLTHTENQNRLLLFFPLPLLLLLLPPR